MPVRFQNNRNLGPRNRRTVNVAQNAIKRVAPMAQEQYENALQVNGYPCIIYQRLENGRKCSCSKAAKKSPTVLDEEGNATQEHINTLLTGSKFGIDDYGSQPSSNKLSSSPMESPYPTTGSKAIKNEKSTNITNNIDNVNSTIVEDFVSDDFILEQDFGSDTAGRCGVCFSSGFVGGYNVFNGVRIVLDTTLFDSSAKKRSSLYATSIAYNMFPNAFELNNFDSYVIFETVIPKNIIEVQSIRVMDNLEQLTQARIHIKNESMTDFIELNSSNIYSFATGLPIFIKVSGVSIFTHLEMQFASSSEETKIEYPRITKTGDVSVLEGIDSVSLVASPKVTDLKPWDIIADSVFGKIWRVTNSNLFNDNNMNNHGWDVQARLVQEYEIQSYLFVKGRKPKKTTNFNR